MSEIVNAKLNDPVLIAIKFPSQYAPSRDIRFRATLDTAPKYLVPTPLYGQAIKSPKNLDRVKNIHVGFSPSFYDDFFERIHLIPQKIDVGIMLSNQTRDVEVWNAHRQKMTLTSINGESNEGITISQSDAPPTEFPAYSSRVYSFSISMEGPPNIDATYRYLFDGDYANLAIVGSRVLTYGYVPQTIHTEGYEWKTDIITSYNKEQRIAMRDIPRQEFKYSYQLSQSDFSKSKAALNRWAGRIWGVPAWSQVEEVGSLNEGATAIDIDTRLKDYFAGDSAFIWQSNDDNLVVNLQDVAEDRLTLELPLSRGFDRAFICPLRYGWTLGGIDFVRDDFEIVRASARFELTDNKDFSGDATGYDRHDDLDVIRSNTVLVSGSLNEKISKELEIIDNGLNNFDAKPKNNFIKFKQNITFDISDKAEQINFRKWIFSLKGKQKPFWLPSWNNDLHLASDVPSGSTNIVCIPIGYANFYDIKDIAIRMNDGTKIYNRILASIENDDGNEVYTLRDTIDQNINTSNVEIICFMSKVRLDTDRLTMNHKNAGRITGSLAVVEVKE